jgi:hypothetical protein
MYHVISACVCVHQKYFFNSYTHTHTHTHIHSHSATTQDMSSKKVVRSGWPSLQQGGGGEKKKEGGVGVGVGGGAVGGNTRTRTQTQKTVAGRGGRMASVAATTR